MELAILILCALSLLALIVLVILVLQLRSAVSFTSLYPQPAQEDG